MKYLSAIEVFLPFQKIMNCFEEQGPTLIGKSILPQSFFHHYKTRKYQRAQNREIQTFTQNITPTALIFNSSMFHETISTVTHIAKAALIFTCVRHQLWI